MTEILGWTGQHPRVEAWSEHRLPFEPKGDMHDFRNQLRDALCSIPATVSGTLVAEYRSEAADACDVENILFYNVGAQPFTRLRVRNLAFARLKTPSPPGKYGTARHYVSYRIIPSIPAEDWASPIATFESAPLSTRNLGRPWHVWYALKCGEVLVSQALSDRSWFRLRIDVQCPQPDSTNLFGILKPLLDGVIASLQPSAAPGDQPLMVLASALGIEAAAALALLMNTARTAMQPPSLILRPFGPGRIQINPADDLLNSAVVTLSESPNDEPHIRGELYRA